MTKVTFYKKSDRIVRVRCVGHTGYGEYGEDIVCAALSAIVQTGALGILQVLGLSSTLYQVDSDKGIMELTLSSGLIRDEADNAAIILDTMYAGVSDLCCGYSEFIELEVK